MELRKILKKITPRPIWNILRAMFVKFYNIKLTPKLYMLSENLDKCDCVLIKKIIFSSFPFCNFKIRKKQVLKKMVFCIGLNYNLHDKQKYIYEIGCFQSYLASIDIKIFSFYEWQKLKQIAICCGMFKVANICRNKAYDLLFYRQKTFFDWSLAKILVYIERGNLNKAKEIFGTIEADEDIRKILNKYLYLFDNVSHTDSDFDNLTDKKFLKYIRGQNIAILGPVFDGYETVESDIYIRNNFKGANSIPENQAKIKTHITYYNGGVGESLMKTPLANFLNEPDFLVFKDMHGFIDISLFHSKIQDKMREANRISSLFIYSSPYMLPIMLFDLLRFNPNSIKIYGNTMYNSYNIHSKEYTAAVSSNPEFNIQKLLCSFSIHGIIDNFIFLQVLYKHGLFQADDYFSSMLEKPVENYLQQMEERWVYPYI